MPKSSGKVVCMNTYTQRLTTYLCPHADRKDSTALRYTVLWRAGHHSQGTIHINVPTSQADAPVVAELAALQYLLEDAGIAGKTVTGQGLMLIVSQGIIRKLMDNQCAKHHLYAWASFLNTRFSGARCLVQTDCPWELPYAKKAVHAIDAKAPQRSLLPIPLVGMVAVSRHAIERLAKHLNYPTTPSLWSRLVEIASSQSMMFALPDHFKVARDEAVHGKKAIRLFDPKSKWMLIFVSDGRHLVLVTLYQHFGRHHLPGLGHGRKEAGQNSGQLPLHL